MAKTDIYLDGKNLLDCEWQALTAGERKIAIAETNYRHASEIFKPYRRPAPEPKPKELDERRLDPDL